MKSRILLIALVAALATTACADASNPQVATVNGTPIHLDEVAAIRPIYGDGPTIDLSFRVADTTLGEQLRSDTSLLIFKQAMLDRLSSDFGIVVTDAEIAALAAQLPLQNPADFALPIDPEEVRRFDATIESVRRNALDNLLDEGTLGPIFDADPAQFSTVCARHVLVATRGEAETVVTRLTGGEDFAAVADEVSTDVTPGGDLGCRSAAEYVPAFAAATIAAPLGTVFGPVETEFGFHVLVVDDRTGPTDLADLVANAEQYVSQNLQRSVFSEWFNRAIIEADIEVASWLGTWSQQGQGIAPPA